MCVCADRVAALPTVMTIWLRLRRGRTGVYDVELDSTRKKTKSSRGGCQGKIIQALRPVWIWPEERHSEERYSEYTYGCQSHLRLISHVREQKHA